jgi:hypothetical protein
LPFCSSTLEQCSLVRSFCRQAVHLAYTTPGVLTLHATMQPLFSCLWKQGDLRLSRVGHGTPLST